MLSACYSSLIAQRPSSLLTSSLPVCISLQIARRLKRSERDAPASPVIPLLGAMHIWLVALWALFVASALVDSAAVHRRVKRGDLEKIIGGVKGVGHLLGFRSDKILKKGSNLLAKIGDRPIVGKVVSHLLNSNDDDAGDTEVDEEQKPKLEKKPKIHRKSFEEYANMEEDDWAELKMSERRKALRRFPKLAKLHASVDE